MTQAQRHRGPDDDGLMQSPDGACTFGHRRLSIIDLSPAGRQPMRAANGDMLVFNGEIYNFKSLRIQLEQAGCTFVGNSDSEVLLHGLCRHGPAFIDRLDGMYAFAFWSAADRTLLTARDPFGEKPMYLCRVPGGLAFASELNALTRLPDFDDRVSTAGIAEMLAFQYVAAPCSIYESCRKLRPGEAVLFDRNGTEHPVSQQRFRTSAVRASARSLDESADQLDEILTRTIADRLVSDAPLGLFLSGGIDSSLVAAVAAERLNCGADAFTLGFEGAADSEHDDARRIAEHLGLTCRTEIIAPARLGEQAALIGGMLDEPNGDSSCLPTFRLSQAARRCVAVALSGDGGDELFGGYGRYFAMLRDARTMPDTPAGDRYFDAMRILFFPQSHLQSLFGAAPEPVAGLIRRYKSRLDDPTKPLINRLRELDAQTYLPGAVLAKVDRMSMQCSLEVRSPFLGREIAAFAAGLAAQDCADEHSGKHVLKTLARRYLPAEWIDRPKRGFGIPMLGWAEGDFWTETKTLFSAGSRLAEWIGQDFLERFLEAQKDRPLIYQLWELTVLEHWLRTHPARPA